MLVWTLFGFIISIYIMMKAVSFYTIVELNTITSHKKSAKKLMPLSWRERPLLNHIFHLLTLHPPMTVLLTSQRIPTVSGTESLIAITLPSRWLPQACSQDATSSGTSSLENNRYYTGMYNNLPFSGTNITIKENDALRSCWIEMIQANELSLLGIFCWVMPWNRW